MLETIFWLSVVVILYAYFGYPASLLVLAKLKGKFYKHSSSCEPMVSIIIAGANEEQHIANKLNNTLKLDYPELLLEIIVASDASTDEMDDIVKAYSKQYGEDRIRLVRLDKKGGKEAAQKLAISQAKGNILVFTDVATTLDTFTLRSMIGYFGNPKIGAVDGMSRIVGIDGKVSGEGAYLKYENKIRQLESALAGTVSLGGCLFAARKEILEDFSDSLQSDFRTALKSAELGYVPIIDVNAVAKFKDTANQEKEFNRKVRTVVRGINNLAHHLHLLNPFKYGMFTYQLFSHKLVKWLVPFFMIAAFLSNFIIAASVDLVPGEQDLAAAFWSLMIAGQLLFYLVAFHGITSKSEKVYFKIPGFFLMANVAILKAWFEYAKGERYVTWTPTKR